MNSVPDISVCIPVLDGALYLAAAIESVLSQKGVSLEVVICDNNSSDDSVPIASSFDDPRIRIFKHTRRLNMCENWNRAISYSSASWIKILPCDDRLTEGSLFREQSALLNHSDAVLAIGGKIICSRKGRPIARIQRMQPGIYYREALRSALLSSPVNLLGEPGSALFSKKSWEGLGGFNESLHFFCDVEFYARLLDHGPIVVLDAPSALFRIHGGSMSSQLTHSIYNEYLRYRELYSQPRRKGAFSQIGLFASIMARQIATRVLDKF